MNPQPTLIEEDQHSARRGGRQRTSPVERFHRNYTIDAETGCHVWQRSLHGNGYGCCGTGGKGKTGLAHRFAYELANGPIPAGLVIDHLCRNRACVNPAHLEAVTNRENVLRGNSPGAQQARASVCRNGHALDAANLADWGRGRICRTCKRDRARAAYAAQREAQNGQA